MTEDSITLNNQSIPYIVKRSSRARHIRLEMRRDTGLTIFVPRFYSLGQMRELLKTKQDWILRNFNTYAGVRSPSVRKGIKIGDVIPYLGWGLEILTTEGHEETDHVRLERNKLIVSATIAKKELNAVIEQWYRIQIAELIKEKTDTWRAKLHVSYNRITIRGQKTRWGSCSHKGNLNFNWKLLMAPEAVIEYVVIHELSHLKEMNHSKRFWQLVAEHCPRWREHRKWLKIHESELAAGLFAHRAS